MPQQTATPSPAATIPLPTKGDFAAWVKSWRRDLLAQNRAPNTVIIYMDQMKLFGGSSPSRACR